MDPERREQVEAACVRGGTSIHSTGSSPGFITEAMPLVLTSMQRRLDTWSSTSSPTSPGGPRPSCSSASWATERTRSSFDPGRWAHGVQSFGPSLRLVAEEVGLPLDDGGGQRLGGRGPTDHPIAAGTIEAGTVAAQRMRVAGMRGGEPLLAF